MITGFSGLTRVRQVSVIGKGGSANIPEECGVPIMCCATFWSKNDVCRGSESERALRAFERKEVERRGIGNGIVFF